MGETYTRLGGRWHCMVGSAEQRLRSLPRGLRWLWEEDASVHLASDSPRQQTKIDMNLGAADWVRFRSVLSGARVRRAPGKPGLGPRLFPAFSGGLPAPRLCLRGNAGRSEATEQSKERHVEDQSAETQGSRVDRTLETARDAQNEYGRFDQEQVDAIFKAAALAANMNRIPLAKLAVEETGIGLVEDKVIKVLFDQSTS